MGGGGHRKFPYCWFARDVTAAMLVVKNKGISLLWELLYFHANSSRKYSFALAPNMAALLRGYKPRINEVYILRGLNLQKM